MATTAKAFASAYDAEFKRLTARLGHHEVPLFQAMEKALVGVGNRFHVEEYHGFNHQVTFSGDGLHARLNARCELSDLMIIAYSRITKEVRMTFLQAKSERSIVVSGWGHSFKANLEQWFLLSRRPSIAGVGSRFSPPADLLSSALLSSVGSFAFFYKDPAGDFQTFYASAAHLFPAGRAVMRKGSLTTMCPPNCGASSGAIECVTANGNSDFGHALYGLEIGTPILAKAISNSARTWLASVLRGVATIARSEDRPADLAFELAEMIGPAERASTSYFGAKKLIIIRSDDEGHRG